MEKITTGFEIIDPRTEMMSPCRCSEGSWDVGLFQGSCGCQCGCKSESSSADNQAANHALAYPHRE